MAVVIEPRAAVLNIGETQQFGFKAFGEDGREITGVLASWSSDLEAGTMGSNGLFTPGVSAGLHIGAVEVQVVSGTSRVSHSVNIDIIPDALSSIEVGPFVSEILASRLELLLEVWPQLSPKVRRYASRQIRYAWAHYKRRLVIGVMRRTPRPEIIRFALAPIAGALSWLDKVVHLSGE